LKEIRGVDIVIVESRKLIVASGLKATFNSPLTTYHFPSFYFSTFLLLHNSKAGFSPNLYLFFIHLPKETGVVEIVIVDSRELTVVSGLFRLCQLI